MEDLSHGNATQGKHARQGVFWPFIKALSIACDDYYFFTSDMNFINSLHFDKSDEDYRLP
eukprot:447982-Amorphochlora_amoeboformis.AAC.2